VEPLLLKVENISKSFPGVLALDKMNMDLRKGEVHAIVGENGAGKSTLMKILSGVYQPDEGKIYYKDKETRIEDPHDAQLKGISIIYQELNLAPHLTVAQNIFLGREPLLYHSVLDRKKQNELAVNILKTLNLEINPETLVKDLGVSKKQMVEIAKALSCKSEILIMDEPTSALSESEIDELFKVIHQLRKEGVGIFYISHRLEELKHIVDRISIIRDGKLIGTHDYGSLTLDEIISKMVGRTLQDKFPHRDIKIGEKVLEVKNLYRKDELEDIHFSLNKGEILGIAGLMGAGRTELARALFGADKIDKGNIYIDGKEVAINSPRGAIKEFLGFITEDRKKDGLAMTLTVDDYIVLANVKNVSNGLGIISKKKKREVGIRFTNDLKIKTPSLQQKVNKLSGGNQQKVVLAKWLCRKTKILIMDEPTRGIDVGAKFEVYELMNQLVSEGMCIIMISSELPEIIGMSDRILVLCNGRVSGEISKHEATQERILSMATGLQ
jgi:ribose transport system ATP-binding protein